MKKIIIAILSVVMMTQSSVTILAEDDVILETTNTMSEITEISEDLEFENRELNESGFSEDFSEEKIETNDILKASKSEPDFLKTIEYGKKKPSNPELHDVGFKVTSPFMLKQFLENTLSLRIELGADMDLSETIVIPPGVNKELDLGGHTINAGTTGQFEVRGDYFKLKNGNIIGARGDRGYYGKDKQYYVPNEANHIIQVPTTEYLFRNGLIYAPPEAVKNGPPLENDIVIEDITHRSFDSSLSDKATGGFIVTNTSNVFFKGENNLTNGNYNIKGGSVTFMDGKFTGKVTRQDSSSLGFDSYGYDGTINIGFYGYGTKNERAISDITNGDKRVTVLEDAEVELYNYNKKGDKWYTNNIGNFSVITIEGSLKMESTYPPLRSIISETNSRNTNNYYKDSKAHTFNGMANINVLEGATLIAEAKESDGTHGAIFTYNTIINAYHPAELDIDDMTKNNKEKNPFFHSGYKKNLNSQLNLYDMDVAVWPVNKTERDDQAVVWDDVDVLEHIDFSSFLLGNSAGYNKKAEPTGIGLKDFNIRSYGRIRSEGDFPQIIPDKKFLEKGRYTVGNGDGTVNGAGTMDENGLFYGTARFRKLDDFGHVVPVVNGEVILENNLNPTEKYTTRTDSNGNWVIADMANINPTVGWYSLFVNDGDRGEGYKSRKVKVYVKDTIPPTGETQLIRVKEKDYKNALLDASLSVTNARDETTSQDKLVYEYINFPETERRRVLDSPGLHTLRVGISDEADNETRLDAPVFVYKDGTDPERKGFVDGHDFEIDKNIFGAATPEERREMVIKYGEAKGYEFTNTGYNEVTSDLNKFQMEFGSVSSDGKKVPITLKLIINGVEEDKKTINAILVDDSIVIRIRQVEQFYNGNPEIAKHSVPIYSDLENKIPLDFTPIFYPKPVDNQPININKLIDDLDTQKRIQIDRLGYDRNKVLGDKFVTYTQYKDKTSEYEQKSEISYDSNKNIQEVDIYVEYSPQTIFANVPNLTYGDIEITSKNEETYALETPKPGGGSSIGTNKATVINTNKKNQWSINLAVKDNKIENKNGDQFLGGLVFYKQSKEFDITGTPRTLITYNEPDKDKVELIKDINFHSQDEDEGIRLKQRMGNAVGNYEGKLLWTLTDAPIP